MYYWQRDGGERMLGLSRSKKWRPEYSEAGGGLHLAAHVRPDLHGVPAPPELPDSNVAILVTVSVSYMNALPCSHYRFRVETANSLISLKAVENTYKLNIG